MAVPASGATLWTDDNGGGDRAQAASYYDVLGVARDASPDDIRRAYRRAACEAFLSFHNETQRPIHPHPRCSAVPSRQTRERPRGRRGVPAYLEGPRSPMYVPPPPRLVSLHVSKLTLRCGAPTDPADAKKREVYDKYGANGVEMMDKMPFLDVSMILAIKNLFAVISLGIAVLLLLPVFVSLKVDGRVSWSWPAVFSPSYVVLGIALLVAIGSPLSKSADPDSGDPPEPLPQQLLSKAINVAYFSLLLAFDVVVPLKIDGTLSANWGSVFAPWFLLEAYHVYSLFTSVIAAIKEGVPKVPAMDEEENDESSSPKRPMKTGEIVAVVFAAFNFPILRIIQAILLVYKLDNQSLISWPATFNPLYILIVLNLLSMTASFFVQTRPHLTSPQEKLSGTVVFVVGFTVVAAVSSVFTYLLVRRIDGGDGWPPAAVILIPVFFVLALALCCCGCVLPCVLTLGLRAQMEEMGEVNADGGERVFARAERNGGEVVPLARRLEAPAQG
ncbi:hypothetical protein HDU83_003409 [Entophlyctis luteolus]|nr:hypothetical protein HDU83_003409 [Entophlyctis luteolus]